MDEHDENKGFSNANKQSVTRVQLYVVCISALVLLVVWAVVVCLNICNPLAFLMQNIADVVTALVALSVAIFGITIANKGAISKGGTVYYPKKNGQKKLDPILEKYAQKNQEPDYTSVKRKMQELLNLNTDCEFDSEYFKYVYALQERNSEGFNLVWNDYNFYSAKSVLNKKEKKYFDKLKKHIFYCVYEEYKKHSSSK